MKQCKRCNKVQETTEFHKHPYSRDKLQSTCKTCMKVVSKEQYEKHKNLKENNLVLITNSLDKPV